MDNLEKKAYEYSGRKNETRAGLFSHINPSLVRVLWREGYTLKEISDVYGCSPRTVRNQMRKKGYEYTNDLSLYSGEREKISPNVGRKRPDVTEDEVIKLRSQGYTIKKIASLLTTTEKTVTRRLSSVREQTRINKSELENEKVSELYRNGSSIREIAKRFSCSPYFINKALKYSRVQKRSFPREDIQNETSRLYELIGSVNGVAKQLRVSKSVVQRILLERGYTLPSNSLKKEIDTVELKKQYNESAMNVDELAEHFGCTRVTMYKRLREAGVKFKGHDREARKSNLNKKKIRSEFKNGKSIYRLCIDHQCKGSTIKKIIKGLIK